MPRRVPIETKINHERWLVSYSDFVTLLFGFFVVMYSVSQVNENKYRLLSASLSSVFSSVPPPETVEVFDSDPAFVGLDTLIKTLSGALQESLPQTELSLDAGGEWISIELDANVLFGTGDAELTAQAKTAIASLAKRLAPIANAVTVAGHTDNLPISNARYANNWALSSARAVAVVNHLSLLGVQPERLSAVAYGEFRPKTENSSEAGRRANRRVVIKVSQQAPRSRENALAAQLSALEDSNDVTEAVLPPEKKLEAENTKANAPDPVRLESGALLFTSDPELPRIDRPREADLPQ